MNECLEGLGLGSYRGELDIIAAILEAASKNAKKTHIMFQANLSYKVLVKYLLKLREASLIRFVCDKQCYVLTVKGSSYLEAYTEYSRRSRELEKRVSDVDNKRKNLEELL